MSEPLRIIDVAGEQRVMLGEEDITPTLAGYTIHGNANERPEVTLTLGRIIDVSTLADPGKVMVDGPTVDLLRRLGFTPPDDYTEPGPHIGTDPAAANPDLDTRAFGALPDDDDYDQRDYEDDRMAAQAIVDRVRAEGRIAGKVGAFGEVLTYCISHPDVRAGDVTPWLTDRIDELTDETDETDETHGR